MILLCFFVVFYITLSFSEVVNKDVVRTIDATTAILRISVDLKATNVENKQYILIFPDYEASHLAFIQVTAKGSQSPLPLSAPVT